jgi:hypothetical protein
MPSSTKPAKPIKLSTFPNKFIYVKEIFQGINKQMLETSYRFNLGKLFKIAPKLKRYMW